MCSFFTFAGLESNISSSESDMAFFFLGAALGFLGAGSFLGFGSFLGLDSVLGFDFGAAFFFNGLSSSLSDKLKKSSSESAAFFLLFFAGAGSSYHPFTSSKIHIILVSLVQVLYSRK